MFVKWLQQNDLRKLLSPPEAYHPYPTVAERSGWAKAGIAPAERERILKVADEYRNYAWPALPATAYMAFKRHGDRTAYKMRDERRHVLPLLVAAECLTGNGDYLDDIINGIWFICEESFWGISAHNSPFNYGLEADALPDYENHYIDIAAASTAGQIAHIYYLLREPLETVSKRLVRRMQYELEERIIKPFLRHEDFWWMGFSGQHVNNWNPWIISNMLSVFLLVERDQIRREAGIIKSMRCLDAFLREYHADGGCDEGTSYWNVAGGALFDCLEQLDHASDGRINFWGEPLIQEMGRFIYRMHIADNYFINFADGGAIVHIDNEMVYRYGRAIGDALMMSLATNVPASNKDKYPVQHNISRFMRTVFDCGEKIHSGVHYENDVWLSGIQVMAARQFADSTKGLYLAAKGGHNDESHNHNDVGSCVVYFNGKPLFIDIGVGIYTKQTFSADRYSIWTMQSQYHNLPR